MDKLVLEKAMEASSEENVSPFTSYQMISTKDQASAGNYGSAQSVFETISLSNSGKWTDYSEAYFTIPVIIVASTKLDAVDSIVAYTGSHLQYADTLLGLKNSNLNLINSIQIDYGNTQMVQASDYINEYLIYKQHETMSEQDELLNGSTIGYAKDCSTSWYYSDESGIGNNHSDAPTEQSAQNVQIQNDGLFRRQQEFKSVSAHSMQKDVVLGGLTQLKEAGQCYIENFDTHRVMHYNAIVRLKDLPVFQHCGLMKGANWRITMQLNTCIFDVYKNDVGKMEFAPSTFSGKQTNPVMVSQSKTQFKVTSGSGTTNRTAYSGAICLPDRSITTVSCSVGSVLYSKHSGLQGIDAHFKNVELHVPTYTLKPSVETALLGLGQKKVSFNEVISFVQRGKSGVFNELITNGLARMKRMIICPILASSGNGSQMVDPFTSPFSTEPATCSPYIMDNFQVRVASSNLFHTPIQYSYESYLSEMSGKYGINSNMEAGLSSSRISFTDWQNNYGYIVVDLKRKNSSDDSVPLSLQISGKVVSPKPLDFYVFVEVERTMTYDVATGKLLSKE